MPFLRAVASGVTDERYVIVDIEHLLADGCRGYHLRPSPAYILTVRCPRCQLDEWPIAIFQQLCSKQQTLQWIRHLS